MHKKGGWTNHPREHALAARGIPCRASAVFRPYRPTGFVDYRDNREWIFAFWKASIEDDWDEFDFKRAFVQARKNIFGYIENEWGYMPVSARDFEEFIEGRIWAEGEEENQFYLDVTENKLEKLLDVVRQLEAPPARDVEKVFLLDKIVHMQHYSGYVLWDREEEPLDIPGLRAEFERVYGVG